MNAISMRLPDDVLRELDRRATLLKLSRTQYIREAVRAMNRAVDEKHRRARIRNASLRVRGESLRVNTEFSRIEHDPD
jgi:metal-responsive CopG/Arc/MetJ family transcriptional regulator